MDPALVVTKIAEVVSKPNAEFWKVQVKTPVALDFRETVFLPIVVVYQLPDVVPNDAHEEHRYGDRDEHPVADVRVETERAHLARERRGAIRRSSPSDLEKIESLLLLQLLAECKTK